MYPIRESGNHQPAQADCLLSCLLLADVGWHFYKLSQIKLYYFYGYNFPFTLQFSNYWSFFSIPVAHCPSSFVEIGHSVQFVALTCDELTLSVCYENGNHSVMALFDVPTLASSVSWSKFNSLVLNKLI